MVCRKSYGDASIALLAIVVTVVSLALTGVGTIRRIYDLKDDNNINSSQLILSGTLISILSMFITLFILFSGDPGISGPIILALLLLFLVIILYLTNYDPTDPGSQWTVLITTIIDAILKVGAVLLGYGVCTVQEVPGALLGMGRVVMGGKR
jgi:hypothetical protein